MERLVVRVGGIASSRVRFRANRTLMRHHRMTDFDPQLHAQLRHFAAQTKPTPISLIVVSCFDG